MTNNEDDTVSYVVGFEETAVVEAASEDEAREKAREQFREMAETDNFRVKVIGGE